MSSAPEVIEKAALRAAEEGDEERFERFSKAMSQWNGLFHRTRLDIYREASRYVNCGE